MNILMVHPHDIFSPLEPWTRRIRCISKQFVAQGHQVKLVYFSVKENGRIQACLNGYEVIPYARVISPLTFVKNIQAMIKLADWADVVHFQKCHHYASIPAVIAAYFKGKHLHYDWDDWEEMIWLESCGRGLFSRLISFSYNLLERFLPILSNTVSVASVHLKDLVIKLGVKEESVFFAPVGADLDEFNPSIDGTPVRERYAVNTPLVLYLGQLHGAQHVDLFINAASIVLQEGVKATFMIVGSGSMVNAIKGYARELHIEEKIIFTGAVAYDKVPEYIAAADICVAVFRDTSVSRCKSPLKIVEYMAMGKAIVASEVGEIKRMLGGAGILVEPGNAQLLAQGIINFLREDSLRYKLGRRARKSVEDVYNWTITARSLLKAYEQSFVQASLN